jgi:Na+-transporting methylmalonyl-CoA/oxaloacetate decarboxylase gamma subunit
MPEPYHRGQERLARRVLGVAFVLLVVSFLATWLVARLH